MDAILDRGRFFGHPPVAGYDHGQLDNFHPRDFHPQDLQLVSLHAVERLYGRVDIEDPRLGQRYSCCHESPASSSILSNPRRTASALTTFCIPSNGGLTESHRNVAMWE